MDLEKVNPSLQNKLTVKEPAYPGIPSSILRRMGKAVRYGIGAALPLFDLKKEIHGIIIGTGHGGMEDCIKFLNQIIDYEEGTLTPTNFVQSTANAIASQLGMMSNNTGHNCTHVHSGLSFENALLETMMLLKEFPDSTFLLGGVEEISTYQYTIEKLAGWYKKEECTNNDLFESETLGSIAGEGAAMFLVNNNKEAAAAEILDLLIFETRETEKTRQKLAEFINKHGATKDTLLCSGENGDSRHLNFYEMAENELSNSSVIRFKHLTGEYSSVTSAALWFCIQIFSSGKIPGHMIKKNNAENPGQILIYNCHQGIQHSIMLLKKV